jgi:hypothetical protein
MNRAVSGVRNSVWLFIISTFILSWTCWFLAPHSARAGLYIKINESSWLGISNFAILTFLGGSIRESTKALHEMNERG